MVKRIFAIIGISLGVIVATFGGVFGVKFLKGDFNEKFIPPEIIKFDKQEYNVTNNFKITISTDTPDVTMTSVVLSFAKGKETKYGVDKITDGVIIVPKAVKLNTPFNVELCKALDSELFEFDDVKNQKWIKGGISELFASSESTSVAKVNAKVYVDVPVYKTEIIVFNEKGEIKKGDFENHLSVIENNEGFLKQGESILNKGDTFYMGLKFYPARSAYKYSKVTSTNMLVENYDDIMSSLERYNLTDKIAIVNNLKNLLTNEQEKNKEVYFSEIINYYNSIVNVSKNSQNGFDSYLNETIAKFEKNLKMFTLDEKYINESQYTKKIERIAGTNIYKFVANANNILNDIVTVRMFSYVFKNSSFENILLSTINDETTYEETLGRLEELYKEDSNRVDYQTKDIQIKEVEVDTIKAEGNMNNFSDNKVYNIFAMADGVNDESNSFIKISLKNSNIENIDLQNKILNVGIRFEKSTTSSWGSTDDISVLGDCKKVKVQKDGISYTYYLPNGTANNFSNAYWQIFAENYTTDNYRIVYDYFINYRNSSEGQNEFYVANEEDIVESQEANYLNFNLTNSMSLEKAVTWNKLDDIELGLINLSGVVDEKGQIDEQGKESTKDVKENTFVDLTKLISIPSTNNYTTYKFFLYSDDEDTNNPITNYFNVKSGRKYTLFNGIEKQLYELDDSSNILRLKGAEIPEYSVRVIFSTIQTDASKNNQPVLSNDGHYTFVKTSSIKSGSNENLSYLTIKYYKSINELKGNISIIEHEKAGIVDNVLKVAKASSEVLKVDIKLDISENKNVEKLALINEALQTNKLRVEARRNKDDATNFIHFTTEEKTEGNNTTISFILSTENITNETVVRLYFIYYINGKDYLFPITNYVTGDSNISTTFNTITIVNETSNTISFNFSASGDTESIETSNIEYIEVSTKEENGKFVKQYSAKLIGQTESVNIDFVNNGQLKVLAKNFLGNIIESGFDWYLTSSSPSKILVVNEKSLNYVSASTNDTDFVTISLYLKNGEQGQFFESFKMLVKDNGKISKVEVNGNKIYDYTNDTQPYSFDTILLEMEGKSGSIQLNELINIYYIIVNGVNGNNNLDKPLMPTVRLANVSSIENYNAITGEDKTEADNGINNGIIELNKNLGSSVIIDINLVYEDLGFVQPVKLTLTSNISVKTVGITDIEDQPVILEQNGYQKYYSVYVGIPYTIKLEMNNYNENLYYAIQLDNTLTSPTQINKNDNVYSLSLTFPDFSATNQKIHIYTISNNTLVSAGDLDYVLEFRVLDNLVQNDNYQKQYQITSTSPDSIKIELTDLIQRKFGILNNNPIQNTITFSTNNSKVDTNNSNLESGFLNIKLLEFTNSLQVTFNLKYENNIVGGKSFTITILAENLESDNDVFALYNGEKVIVLSNGQSVSVDTIKGLFKTGATVDCSAAFFSVYTTGGKLSYYSNNLFTPTDYYVTAKNDANIATTYRIVISKLNFPFVNFVDDENNPIKYNNLDVYKLFVDTNNLLDTYQNLGIKPFEKDKAIYNTTDDGIISNENTVDITYLNDIVVLGENNHSVVASNYASLNYTNNVLKLDVNPVGFVDGLYFKVTLKIAQNDTTEYVYIPLLFKVEQDQILKVKYPNAENTEIEPNKAITFDGNNIGNYGTDEYDENVLKNVYSSYENKYFEYLKFNELGEANLQLTNNRFAIYGLNKKENQYVYEIVENYFTNGKVSFAIEKLYKNIAGQWIDIDENEYLNYVIIENGRLTLKKYQGLTALRVKIKVITDSDAFNYYYVSAGETLDVSMKRTGQGLQVIGLGESDQITVKRDEFIIIGNAGENPVLYTNEKYNYYITNNNEQLKFRILDKNGVVCDIKENIYCELATDQDKKEYTNKIVISSQPLGNQFFIEIYTLYGVVCTVTVNVQKDYTIQLKDGNIFYSGTEYEINTILTIQDNIKNENLTAYSVSLPTVIEKDLYYDIRDGKLIIKHLNYNNCDNITFNLKISITITLVEQTYTFDVTFENCLLKARIKPNYTDSSPYQNADEVEITTVITVSMLNEITINKDIIAKLFCDLKENNGVELTTFDELSLFVMIDGKEVEWNDTTANFDYTLTNAVINQQYKLISFIIKEGEEIIASSYARFTINPYYNVTINYPFVLDVNGKEQELTAEYVVKDTTIDLSEENEINKSTGDSNKRPRISITYLENNELKNKTDYTLKIGDEILNGTSITINSNVEIGIYIGDVQYATYTIKVVENSPYAYEQNEKFTTLYYGYGDDNIWGYVDAIVTVPNIPGLTNTSMISLYYKSGSNPKNINEDIFYSNGLKIRCAIPIEDYSKVINENDGTFVVYCQTSSSPSSADAMCNVQITERGTLCYYITDETGGSIKYRIRLQDYKNVLKNNVDVKEKFTTHLNQLNDIEIGSSLIGEIIYKYDIDLEYVEGTEIVLNANEQIDGFSFVDLFGLKDCLGNVFNKNSIIINKNRFINLQTSGNTGLLSNIRLEPLRYDNKNFNFNIKALGAKIDDTVVTVTFTYYEGELTTKTYEKNITIRVKTDIVHNAVSEVGSQSQNSVENPLKINYVENGSILLTSTTFTEYIYAYSKYDTNQTNKIISWGVPNVSGDRDYLDIELISGELRIKTKQEAKFGNKKLALVFTDPYGYSFNYYIELKAETDVYSYAIDNKQFYEGDVINVYNKNDTNTNTSGIGVILVDDNGNQISESITIKSVTAYFNGVSKSDIVNLDSNNITINYLSYENYWNKTQNSYIICKLSIYIGKAGTTETYLMEVNLTVYKRYGVELKTENSFVRDDSSNDILNHILDVYDYKEREYLGRPTIEVFDEVKIGFGLKTDVIITSDNISSLLNKLKADTTRDSALNELQSVGIYLNLTPASGENYVLSKHFGISVAVIATNKHSGIKKTVQVISKINSSNQVELRLELGTSSSLFGMEVNKENWNFAMSLYNLNNSEVVAETINTKLIQDESLEIGINQISRIKLSTADGLKPNANTNTDGLVLKVGEDIIRINSYKYIDQEDVEQTNEISKGTHNFTLYNDKIVYEKYNNTNSTWVSETGMILENTNINLYTGKLGDKIFINGLSHTDALKSKNINLINANISSNTDEIFKFTDDPELIIVNGIPSERISKQLEISLNNINISEQFEFNITPRYTGVDTSQAYISTLHYCYNNFGEKITNGIINGDITINLNNWSQGFILEAGTGIGAILAQDEDKTFYGENVISGTNPISNTQYISFEPAGISTQTGTNNINETLYTIAENGDITLKTNFNVKDYYIRVNVYCKLGSSEAKTKIATLNIAFVDYDQITLSNANSYPKFENKYKIDISAYNTNKLVLSKENIRLGNCIIDSVVNEGEGENKPTKYIVIDNSNNALNTTSYFNLELLELNFSKVVKFTEFNVFKYTGNSLTITKEETTIDEQTTYTYTISTTETEKIKVECFGKTRDWTPSGVDLTIVKISNNSSTSTTTILGTFAFDNNGQCADSQIDISSLISDENNEFEFEAFLSNNDITCSYSFAISIPQSS